MRAIAPRPIFHNGGFDNLAVLEWNHNPYRLGWDKRVAPADNNNSNRSTLPLPELNPLLNPVLGAHMGRWAEVYFTAPPEKREEAVLELLRELGAAPSSAAVPTMAASERVTRESQVQPMTPRNIPAPIPEPVSMEDAEQEWIVCETCGGRNTVGNRFCGMCATPLPQADHETPSPIKASTKGMWGSTVMPPNEIGDERSAPQDEIYGYKISRREDVRPDHGRFENGDSDEEFHEAINLQAAAESRAPRSSTSNWPERPAVPSLIPEYDEAPGHRRLYLGVTVTVLILGLGYFTWRKSSAISDTAHSLPQPPPAAVDTKPAIPDQTAAPNAQTDTSPAPAFEGKSTRAETSAPPSAVRRPTAQVNRATRKPDIGRQTASAKPAVATPPVPTSEQPGGPIVASLQDNGSAELAVAQSYLNGTHGKVRDTGEAAKWLWRSFGKKNGAAALSLSDLYVRGDGVPQSCDQARLLLDAAARKGTAGASERLRNLPSAGCQ